MFYHYNLQCTFTHMPDKHSQCPVPD